MHEPSLIKQAFAAAYDVSNATAQVALRTAVPVAGDDEREMGDERLVELLGDSVAPFLTRDTRHALGATVEIVGWRLAQDVATPMASPAEEIALMAIADRAIEQIEAALERRSIDATEAAVATEHVEDLIAGHVSAPLRLLREERNGVLEEMGEDEPQFALGDLAPRLRTDVPLVSLWEPWEETPTSQPPPVAVDGVLKSILDDVPSSPASPDRRSFRQRNDDAAVAGLRTALGELPEVGWRAAEVDRVVVTVHGGPASGVLIRPPGFLAGAPFERTSWDIVITDDLAALLAGRDPEGGSERSYAISLERLVDMIDPSHHPLLTDSALSAIEYARTWQEAVGSHALSAGPIDVLEDVASVMRAVVEVRRTIDMLWESQRLQDTRWTRHGLRHPSFANPEAVRWLAEVRAEADEGLPGRFYDRLFEFCALPVSLGIHESDDGVLVSIGMDVGDDPDAAHQLAVEVMDLLRWQLGVTFLSLDGSPDEGEGIEFDLRPVGPEN